VDDVIAISLKSFELLEKAYQKRIKRHKAYFSLDRYDGVENALKSLALNPSEIYERKIIYQALHAAFKSLSDKQARHIYAHYFLGMSKTAIDKTEGISESTVRDSINRGLRNLTKILKNFK
jgi:RNA polymerase sigma-70 factor (ECF subfamily)